MIGGKETFVHGQIEYPEQKRMLNPTKMKPVFCDSSMCQLKLPIVLFFLGVCLVNGFKQGHHIPTFAGPYRVIVGRIGNTSDDYPTSTGKLWLQMRTTQVRGKQSQYGWGQSYASIPISNDMKIELRLATRSNNQWKKNAFVFNLERACTSAMTHVQSVAKMVYGKEIESCPGPVTGLREIKNNTFEFVFPKFPMMPYGWYLFNFAVIHGKTVQGVAEGEVHIEPRL